MEECTLLEVCDMLNSYILTSVQSLILHLGDLWKIYKHENLEISRQRS